MTETLSRLIDEELSSDELEIALNDILLATALHNNGHSWQNFHLIGDIMRGDVLTVGRDLSLSVSAKLELEPTIIAPNVLIDTLTDTHSQPKSDRWKPISMLAIAASLAFVAVIILSPIQQEKSASGDSVVKITPPILAPSEEEKFAREFDEMLAGHGEFAALPGLNGLVAYAKLVSSQSLEQ